MSVEFKEEQKFTQWWLWAILIGVAFIPIIGYSLENFQENVSIDNAMTERELILSTAIMLAILGLIWAVRLKTDITKTEIRIKFWPFTVKTFQWSDVKSAQVLDYGFVGGWGVRLWTKYGTVYNTSGRKGLAIELNNGKKYLIGTQRETDLKTAVNKIQSA